MSWLSVFGHAEPLQSLDMERCGKRNWLNVVCERGAGIGVVLE